MNEETFPIGSMVTYRFPARGKMPPVKMVWYDGGLRPPRPDALQGGDVMGDNVVLLLVEHGDLDLPPAEPPRLTLLRLSQ